MLIFVCYSNKYITNGIIKKSQEFIRSLYASNNLYKFKIEIVYKKL